MSSLADPEQAVNAGADTPGEPDGITFGDAELPFSQLPDWVALSGITPQAGYLYWHLVMHARPGEVKVCPSRDELASRLQFGKTSSIDRYIEELARLGALEVHQQTIAGGMRARNLYVIYRCPPEGYTGPTSNADHYRRRKKSNSDSSGRAVVPHGGPPDDQEERRYRRSPGSPSQGTPAVPHRGPRQSPVRDANNTKGDNTEGDNTPPPDPEPQRPTPTAPDPESEEATGIIDDDRPEHEHQARTIVDQLNLASVGAYPAQRRQLAGDVAARLAAGYDGDTLAEHLTSAVAAARTVTYVRRALDPEHLPTPGDDGNLAAAQELLGSLPDGWRPGSRARDQLAPLAARALRDGWDPDALAAHLTAPLPGGQWIKRPDLLAARRLRELPDLTADGHDPTAGLQRSQTTPPKCAGCGPTRRLEDAETGADRGRCPTCHPQIAGTPTDQRHPQRRSRAYDDRETWGDPADDVDDQPRTQQEIDRIFGLVGA